MRTLKGFAILLSLLLVLILTIFSYWILLLAEKHYAATKMLYDSENARIISEASATQLVLQHNSQTPRFFTDPLSWNELQMKPFHWNDYLISGSLKAPWDPAAVNLLNFQVQRARSFAKMELPVRQIRFEDFAFFSDTQQKVSTSTLFDGNVFVRSGLILDRPVRFREAVHNEVSPSHYASYRRTNRVWLDFPFLSELVSMESLPDGFNITGQDPRFWRTDHYLLDLDQLEIDPKFAGWEVKYKGVSLGQTSTLVLSFDQSVHISQTYREIPNLPSGKPDASLYIACKEAIILNGSLQSLQGNLNEHPLCLYSEKLIRILSDRCATRIQACLLSSGGPSLQLETGSAPLLEAEKQSWISEIRGSPFIMEPGKKEELLQALNNNQKIVWFRGSVGINGSFFSSPDITQIHFEACRKIHYLIPSFPFVQIVEGRQKWL